MSTNDNQSAGAWVGRFAPTPSGPLHFGSLVAALGSYLIAKQAKGEWLLRIEDIDPPRELAGAANNIIKTLETFGFEWDGEISYQSQCTEYYQKALLSLQLKDLIYLCDCSRKLVQARNNGIYDSFCRDRKLSLKSEAAVRVNFQNDEKNSFGHFSDGILGSCNFNRPQDLQDFVIKRRDGLFAYQLAVVIDDIKGGINHVVRGADILDSTPRQNYLYYCFNITPPKYYHLPLVTELSGEKYSKSHYSPSIKTKHASQWLVKALIHLGQNVETDLASYSPSNILEWSIKNWRLDLVPKRSKSYLRS